MATLNIKEDDIPSLVGKKCIVTGGSSGIGLATANFLHSKGADVIILDIAAPSEELPGILFHRCDVSKWEDLRESFYDVAGDDIDYVFANAGILENKLYFAEEFDEQGRLMEPDYSIIDINVKGVYNVVKLAWSSIKRRREREEKSGKEKTPGSIVITTSTAGYAPEAGFPLYSSGKTALVGLIRALRSVIIRDGITINGVAPAPTATALLPDKLSNAIQAQGIPISGPHAIALALVYSATAMQDRRVEAYGKQTRTDIWKGGERWNGRVIFTFGDTYTELEEPIADLRPFWLGRENEKLLRHQQATTDFREESE